MKTKGYKAKFNGLCRHCARPLLDRGPYGLRFLHPECKLIRSREQRRASVRRYYKSFRFLICHRKRKAYANGGWRQKQLYDQARRSLPGPQK